MLEYKGYYGSINISTEDNCLFGKMEYISPLVTFESQTVKGLKGAFVDAVDDYLMDCEKQGSKPEGPFNGLIDVSVGSSIHQAAEAQAREQNISIDEFVKNALLSALYA